MKKKNKEQIRSQEETAKVQRERAKRDYEESLRRGFNTKVMQEHKEIRSLSEETRSMEKEEEMLIAKLKQMIEMQKEAYKELHSALEEDSQ